MRIVPSILLLLLASKTLAQYSDSLFYYVGLNSTGTFNKTVTNSSYLLSNALRLGYKKKDVVMNANTRWLYGRLNERLTNNDLSSLWDLNLYKTFPHFNYWGLLNYTSSYSLRINHQLQAGAGVAYNVIDREALVVNLSNGVLYDYSDVNLPEREVYGTFRNSARLHVKWNLKDRVSVRGNFFLQNSLNYGNDYIVKSDANLAVKVKRWLSLTAGFTYNRMSRTRTENLFVTYGLSLERYF